MNPQPASPTNLNSPAAWIEVSGDDADTFLQSQFSRDLRNIPAEGVYGLWLDHRGRIVADSIVRKLADNHYQLFSFYSPAAIIRTTLEKHIIADDVELLDRTCEVQLLAIPASSPHASQYRKAAKWELPSVRLGIEWQEFLLSAEDTEPGNLASSAPEFERPAGNIEFHRIRNRFFRIPEELGSNHTPADAGLEAAISLDKGCFLGQEVVARTLRLGRATWQPALFRSEKPFYPQLPMVIGEPIQAKITSWVNSADGGIGFGLVKSKFAETLSTIEVAQPDPQSISIDCKPFSGS
jgi:folate-binding protein YgfZ